MTCPNCGATVEPHDVYCMNCGRALVPADQTRHLDEPAPVYSAPSPTPQDSPPTSPPAASYARPLQPPPADPLQPPVATQPGNHRKWASGSSFPAPNPYSSTPNTVSRGTMLNGRPVGGRRNGNGVLQGLGAGVVALLALLKASGAALFAGGFGFFKLYLLLRLFSWLFVGHPLLALLIILLIVGAVMRARTA